MHAGISSQQSAKGSPGPVRETFANDFQQRQLRAADALRAEIIGANRIGVFLAGLLEQCLHLFLRDARGRFFHYCTTKLVNSTSSTSGLPSFFCTARTSVSASCRNFSLPSRDIID